MKKIFIQLIMIICAAALIFSLASCAREEDSALTEAEAGAPEVPGTYSSADEARDTDDVAPAEEAMLTEAEAPRDAAVDAEKSEGAEEVGEADVITEERQVVEPRAGQLTAGVWNDNSNFDFFLELLNHNEWYYMLETWGYEDFSRICVNVFSGDEPIQNAVVELIDDRQNTVFTAKTDNKGIAYVFPYLFHKDEDMEFTLSVSYGDEKTTQKISQIDKNQSIDVDLDVDENRSDDVDIMFVIDTTGSMSDELSYIQSELADVIEQVDNDNANELNIRVSVNFYRDEGDEYVCRPFDFEENISKVLRQLEKQYADGGGDYEEAVEVALANGISDHEWNPNARARIMFLVLDAPPHHNDRVLNTLREQTLAAAAQGIKIIPVASSGVDKNTEFLLRFLDAATNGTYVFLTDDSGIGDSHIEPTVGMYDVEYLNSLLVRLINEEVR